MLHLIISVKVYEIISDADQVRRSRQFPFRFLSAYKELQSVPSATSKVFDALETALDVSVENIPRIAGKTAIVVDVSGSMKSAVSQKSKMTCAEIGLLLGVIATRVCEESIFLSFDTQLYRPTVSARGGVVTQVRNIPVQGGSTHMELPFNHLTKENINVDRIIVFSDNQCNSPYSKGTIQKYADAYRKSVNPSCWVHGVDLQGYSTQQFTGGKTNLISGWSEKIFEFITLAESGLETLVGRVESIYF